MRTKRTTHDQILAAALGQAGLRRTQQAYLQLLLTLWLVLPGRHNFTNLARYWDGPVLWTKLIRVPFQGECTAVVAAWVAV